LEEGTFCVDDDCVLNLVRRCVEIIALYCVGTATRFCQSDARWAAPNVSQCENVAFAMLRITVSKHLKNSEIIV